MQTSVDSVKTVQEDSWNHLLALEEELEKTKEFTEIHQKNFHVSSNHYRSIIMRACAEIENIYQHVCGIVLETQDNISDCISFITQHYKDFFAIEVTAPAHDETIKPWSACIEGKNPAFWTAYIDIKYQGLLEKATLEHAIYAMAGLFSLLIIWH